MSIMPTDTYELRISTLEEAFEHLHPKKLVERFPDGRTTGLPKPDEDLIDVSSRKIIQPREFGNYIVFLKNSVWQNWKTKTCNIPTVPTGNRDDILDDCFAWSYLVHENYFELPEGLYANEENKRKQVERNLRSAKQEAKKFIEDAKLRHWSLCIYSNIKKLDAEYEEKLKDWIQENSLEGTFTYPDFDENLTIKQKQILANYYVNFKFVIPNKNYEDKEVLNKALTDYRNNYIKAYEILQIPSYQNDEGEVVSTLPIPVAKLYSEYTEYIQHLTSYITALRIQVVPEEPWSNSAADWKLLLESYWKLRILIPKRQNDPERYNIHQTLISKAEQFGLGGKKPERLQSGTYEEYIHNLVLHSWAQDKYYQPEAPEDWDSDGWRALYTALNEDFLIHPKRYDRNASKELIKAFTELRRAAGVHQGEEEEEEEQETPESLLIEEEESDMAAAAILGEIKQYSGKPDPEALEAFIEGIDALLDSSNFDSTTILPVVKLKLVGVAKEFVENCSAQDWETLRDELKKEFGVTRAAWRIKEKIDKRSKRNDETLGIILENICTTCEKCLTESKIQTL